MMRDVLAALALLAGTILVVALAWIGISILIDMWRLMQRERKLGEQWRLLHARGMTSKKYDEWRREQS